MCCRVIIVYRRFVQKMNSEDLLETPSEERFQYTSRYQEAVRDSEEGEGRSTTITGAKGEHCQKGVSDSRDLLTDGNDETVSVSPDIEVEQVFLSSYVHTGRTTQIKNGSTNV